MSSATLPPFMNSTGLITKILTKIQEAQEPERYTQDFQGTVLGYGSGSARPFIPFLKRLGFLEADGRPTEVYRRFRNADTAPSAMADAMRIGYKDLYKRNEYCHKLGNDKLRNLIVEVTGRERNAGSVTAIVGSFIACKAFADFEQKPESDVIDREAAEDLNFEDTNTDSIADRRSSVALSENVKMAFGYTINLNLPDTDDPKVFNAIFKALKENLLKD